MVGNGGLKRGHPCCLSLNSEALSVLYENLLKTAWQILCVVAEYTRLERKTQDLVFYGSIKDQWSTICCEEVVALSTKICYTLPWKIPDKRIQHRGYQPQCCTSCPHENPSKSQNLVSCLSTHGQYITAPCSKQDGMLHKDITPHIHNITPHLCNMHKINRHRMRTKSVAMCAVCKQMRFGYERICEAW